MNCVDYFFRNKDCGSHIFDKAILHKKPDTAGEFSKADIAEHYIAHIYLYIDIYYLTIVN